MVDELGKGETEGEAVMGVCLKLFCGLPCFACVRALRGVTQAHCTF